MERRSWPWKKKSSDKQAVTADGTNSSLSSLAGLGDQENGKKANYVQIPQESYLHLSGLEDEVNKLKDQVKLAEEEVKDLKGKLSAACVEMNGKDGLVYQHAKVAEEAVSGWEKADAEVMALKGQLEAVSLLKLSVENRASHLDGALKEWMKQVRTMKEEGEQKLHDAVLAKTIQLDKIKLDLEGKIVELDQKLLRAAAENEALSKSLHEQLNLVAQIEIEKSKVEAEMERVKESSMSLEKEISSLKYELRMVSKELEIHNEEKNISLRSAEAANRQHLESVRRIAKLEAECQRLRGLVRKRLPGPAALAQMKQEVDNCGRDFKGTQSRRHVVYNAHAKLSAQIELSSNNLLQSQKEIDFLTMRLVEMEEETKMLKEALASRNGELQAARDLCAKSSVRVKNLEAQVKVLDHPTSSPNTSFGIPADDPSSQCASNASSVTSLSEEGFDEERHSAESLVLTSLECISNMGMEKYRNKFNKKENAKCFELMDDFLEMEKWACVSNDVDGANAVSGNLGNAGNHEVESKTLLNSANGQDLFPKQELGLSSSKQGSSSVRTSATKVSQDVENLPFMKLLSRIFQILESQNKDVELEKVLEDIKRVMLETGNIPSDQKVVPNEGLISLSSQEDTKQNLASAISKIHQVVLLLGREVMTVHTCTDFHGISKTLDDFSAFVDEFACNEKGLVDFIMKLSYIFVKAGELNFGVLGFSRYDGNVSSNDYIDKVALLKNEFVQDNSSKQARAEGCHHFCHSCPDSEAIQNRILNPSAKPDVTSCSCLLKELELQKLDKEKMALNLARSSEDLENAKLLLLETEKNQTELKLQLASSQNLHSLAETQLKCMTESYKSLEVHAQELEAQVKLLEEKVARLYDELFEEKHNHQNALGRCKELEDKVQRITALLCSSSTIQYSEMKFKQEREMVDATEKLAACQETIYLLGKQLQALRRQTENCQSMCSDKLLNESSEETRLNHSGSKVQEY